MDINIGTHFFLLFHVNMSIVRSSAKRGSHADQKINVNETKTYRTVFTGTNRENTEQDTARYTISFERNSHAKSNKPTVSLRAARMYETDPLYSVSGVRSDYPPSSIS